MFTVLLTTLSVLSLFSFSNDSKARLHALQALKGNQINRQLITQPIVVKPIPKPSIGLQNISNYSHAVDPKHGEKCGPIAGLVGNIVVSAVGYALPAVVGAAVVAPFTGGGVLATPAMIAAAKTSATGAAALSGSCATGANIVMAPVVVSKVAAYISTVEGTAKIVGTALALCPWLP